MNNVEVIESEGKLVVSSRQIAEDFGKRHSDVLESINRLCSTENYVQSMFYESSYKDNSGKSNKEYLINRDGFSLLVMGFTGAEALKWKLKYIEAFNLMEKKLMERQQKPKSQLELLVESAQALLEHERKLTAISTKQDEQAKQIEIINKRIDMFNGIDGTNSREELRHKLNAYYYKNGIPQSKGWNVLKQMYNDSYNTNISLLITNYQKVTGMKEKPTMPEYLEATGQLADAHAVLDKLLN